MPKYEAVDVWSLPTVPSPATAKKEVDEAVGATEFGFNVYEAAPGEQIPWGRHRHPEHEELFFVLAGALVVDTDEGEVRVEPGEAFFIPKNTFNRAHAVGEETCRLVAVGAPKDADGAILEERCPQCGDRTGRDREVADGGDTYVLTCRACGAETDRFSA